MAATGSGEQFVYITTTGRKTGLARKIEIWFVEADGLIYILAEHGYTTKWVKNILANPNVHVRLGDREWRGTARILDPEIDGDLSLKVRELARAKYDWGDGLPVEIRRMPNP